MIRFFKMLKAAVFVLPVFFLNLSCGVKGPPLPPLDKTSSSYEQKEKEDKNDKLEQLMEKMKTDSKKQ